MASDFLQQYSHKHCAKAWSAPVEATEQCTLIFSIFQRLNVCELSAKLSYFKYMLLYIHYTEKNKSTNSEFPFSLLYV